MAHVPRRTGPGCILYRWLVVGCFAITAVIIISGFLLVDERGPVWLKALIAITAALPLLPAYGALKGMEDRRRRKNPKTAEQRR